MAGVPKLSQQRLLAAMPAICAPIPNGKRTQFEKSVISAVQIYFDIRRPKGVPDEIRRLAAAIKDPNADPRKVWQTTSTYAQMLAHKVDELFDPLPNPLSVSAKQFREALSHRVIRGGRWLHRGRRRRWEDRLVGGGGRGRPATNAEVEVLVAFLAAGYAATTDKPVTKQRGDPGHQKPKHTAFELILIGVFRAVGLPHDDSAVKRALDRHLKARKTQNIYNSIG